MRKVFVMLIKLYQLFLSPFLGGQCRFSPSCSVYAIDAVNEHGAWKGMRMAVWRVLRCHPFHPGGYDPVPQKKDRGCRCESPPLPQREIFS